MITILEGENFLEANTKDDANQVDIGKYRFVGFSELRGYIFTKRAKYLKNTNQKV